jgi:hypothetical protein
MTILSAQDCMSGLRPDPRVAGQTFAARTFFTACFRCLSGSGSARAAACGPRSAGGLPLPMQVPAKKVKRSPSMNRAPAVEVFAGRAIRDAQSRSSGGETLGETAPMISRKPSKAETLRQQCLAGIFEKISTNHFKRCAYASFRYPVMTSAYSGKAISGSSRSGCHTFSHS